MRVVCNGSGFTPSSLPCILCHKKHVKQDLSPLFFAPVGSGALAKSNQQQVQQEEQAVGAAVYIYLFRIPAAPR